MFVEMLFGGDVSQGVFWVIALLFMTGWGLAGRWLLLHPDKVFPQGLFTSHHSRLARFGRFEVTLVATFMIFFGAIGAIFFVALLLRVPDWIALLVGIVVGCYVGFRVFKVARQQQKTKSDGSHTALRE
ncbi:MAG: hypothetical protein WCD43_10260 [Candidatus Acidiferrales bacterium]